MNILSQARAEGVRVSVIIPCFNRKQLVAEAIETALEQRGPFEVVIVDDGSTDDSWRVIQSFGSSVRAFRTGNQGVSAARNFGICQARGEYIRFLDSDDRIPAGALAAHLAAAETLPSRAIAFGDAVEISADGLILASSGYGFPRYPPGEELPLPALLRDTMSTFLPLFPISALRACGGFNPAFSLGEDQELAVRLNRMGYAFVRVPITVCHVRQHQGTRLSRNYGAAGYGQLVRLCEHLIVLLDLPRDAAVAPPEARELGRAAWVAGRNASREALPCEARDLFTLAERIAGRSAQVAPAPLRALYTFLSPYAAERLLDFCKLVLGRGGATSPLRQGSAAEEHRT